MSQQMIFSGVSYPVDQAGAEWVIENFLPEIGCDPKNYANAWMNDENAGFLPELSRVPDTDIRMKTGIGK